MQLNTPGSFPEFDRAVPDNGYLWWYVDGTSDDGQQALTLIAFVGSVFSPYYARARQRGRANPLDHCALNVALYGRAARRWTMTERSQKAVCRTARQLQIGPSSVDWNGECLTFTVDEIAMPVPSRVLGQVHIRPSALTGCGYRLDDQGHHHWYPVAPCARIEVALTHPRLRWSGQAYWDANCGDRPMEQDFVGWNWSRASGPAGTTILYEGSGRPHRTFSLALAAAADGKLEPFKPPEPVQLATTGWWRMARRSRADDGQAHVLQTLEDTPFYSRSLLQSQLLGSRVTAVHESLDLNRFRRPWVQWLLPFRMPRAP